jgi:hypothetical protein
MWVLWRVMLFHARNWGWKPSTIWLGIGWLKTRRSIFNLCTTMYLPKTQMKGRWSNMQSLGRWAWAIVCIYLIAIFCNGLTKWAHFRMKKYLGVNLARAFFHICKSGHAIYYNPFADMNVRRATSKWKIMMKSSSYEMTWRWKTCACIVLNRYFKSQEIALQHVDDEHRINKSWISKRMLPPALILRRGISNNDGSCLWFCRHWLCWGCHHSTLQWTGLGPLHTRAKSRDREIVRAQKKSVQRPS